MKKLFLIAIILPVILLIACGEPPTQEIPPAQETPSPEPIPQEPVMLKEWVGSGIKTTESFTIAKQPWVIAYANNPETWEGISMGMLQIMVYDVRNPDIPIQFAANTGERIADQSYIYETGTFYLSINAANTKWQVQVWAVP